MARHVGCWDVSRCVYKAWLALVVESCCAGSVCAYAWPCPLFPV